MTFSDKQQSDHRFAFIEECRQKAWQFACHADWISKSIDALLGDYSKLQEQDRTLEADIKEAENALDGHTVDNRNKRKAMQERRNTLAKQMEFVAKGAQEGQKAMQNLLQSVETSLELAKHAEGWEWKEVATTEK